MTEPRIARGMYLGGQQIAAVVGAHPYMTAHDVWVHAVHGDNGVRQTNGYADNPVMRRGMIVEPGLLEWLRVSRGVPRHLWQTDAFLIDPEVPFFAGTLDGIELDANGNRVHLHEVTSTGSRSLAAWGFDGDAGGALPYKWIQAQWYLRNGDIPAGTITLFVGDTGEIRQYPVERDEDAIESLRESGEAFWMDHVMRRVPPPPPKNADIAGLSNLSSVLDRVFVAAAGIEVDATAALIAAANDYDEARRQMDEAEERKSAAAARVKLELGEGTSAKWTGGRVSWTRNRQTTKTDTEGMKEELIKLAGLDLEAAKALEEKHTTTKDGPRVLRVTTNTKAKK